MAEHVALLFLFALLSLCGGLLLYAFVRSERDWDHVGRDEGEDQARRDRP